MRPLRTLLVAGLVGVSACGRSTPDVAVPPSAVRVETATESPTVATAPTPAVSAAPFAYAGDAGGKLLERLLAPAAPTQLAGDPQRGPKERAPSAVDRVVLPLPGVVGTLPKPTVPPPLANQPRPLPEPPRLDSIPSEPLVPTPRELPVAPLSKAASTDVNTPIELPVHTKPVPDRVTLDDPTRALVLESLLSPVPPARTTPAAFVRLSLPEPFEFLRGWLAQALPSEEPQLPKMAHR
jgi:hypothetical protein